ncbi:MAG: hypothetical protein KGH63_03370 [Candidatus Micrarchaeota archaeon]|nr:hypothetical protein [Candidatus Micrarchaeota archaeon]
MNDADRAVFLLVIGLKMGVFLALAVIAYLSQAVRRYGSGIPKYIMIIGLCFALGAGLQLMGDLNATGVIPMLLTLDQIRILSQVLMGISAFLTVVIGWEFSNYLVPLLLD